MQAGGARDLLAAHLVLAVYLGLKRVDHLQFRRAAERCDGEEEVRGERGVAKDRCYVSQNIRSSV